MSVVGFRLQCDQCGRAWMVAVGATVETARAHARSFGWDHGESRPADRCPRCVRGVPCRAASR